MYKLIKYLLLLILLVETDIGYSQKFKVPQNLPRYDFKALHFGFTLGINSLDFKIKKNNNVLLNDTLLVLESENQKGFNLGIVSNLRLGKYTDLRFIPTLVFGERHLKYSFTDSNSTYLIEKKRIESTLIDFPLYIKYKSERYNNLRTYVLVGIKYSLDIASQDKIDDEGKKIIKLKENDLMGEIGFGMDFYLQYFKFAPQIKLSYGIIDLLSEDKTVYTRSINKLLTNGWMLSFTFE